MNEQPPTLPLLSSLLWRFTIRYWIKHWIKLSLLIGVVGLGAGSFLAIGLANRAASENFDSFAQTVSGQSQIVVTSSLGKLGLSDLRVIRRALLDSEATLIPQLIATARLADAPGLPFEDTVFTVIGMDLLAASNFLVREGAAADVWINETRSDSNQEDFPSFDGFYSQAGKAEALGWHRGQSVPFFLNDRVVHLKWAGELPQIQEDRNVSANVVVLDWKTLSKLLGKTLHADRVDLVFTGSARSTADIAEAAGLLESANPGRWVVESQKQRQQTGATMTLALRMNLRALSALSLLVALCLLFQAMDSAVARRQGEVAILHSIGVSSRITRTLWLADAALIGILGGAFGLAIGAAMARVSVRLVSQTVNTLYHHTGEPTLYFEQGEAMLAWGITVVFCLAAGWWPARQAAQSPLVESMRQGVSRSTYSRARYTAALFVFATLAGIAYKAPPLDAANGHSIPIGGYALTLCLIGLVACLACLCLELVGFACAQAGSRFTPLRIALSQFRYPVTRHRLALVGVTLSVGMTAAMIVLIGSFDATVRAWIGNTLQADLFIRSKAVSAMHDPASLSPAVVSALAEDPRVVDSGSILSSSIRIDGLETHLIGYDTLYLIRSDHTTWLVKPDDLHELKNGYSAIINESFASRFNKSVGDDVTFPTKDGVASFRVIGVYADYGNESGSIGIDQQRYIELTGIPHARGVALHVDSAESVAAVARQIEERFPALQVMTNRWLREETLRIFNRVFSITYALEAIGLFISVAGLGSMLASLLIERRSETGTLIRIGFGPRHVALATFWEGLSIAGLGVAAGLLLGFLLGLALVFVINKQSFGWTLALSFPWQTLAGLCLLSLAGAGSVSYLVGRWSANLPVQNEE